MQKQTLLVSHNTQELTPAISISSFSSLLQILALALATACAVELGYGYSDHRSDPISYGEDDYDIYGYHDFGLNDDSSHNLHKRWYHDLGLNDDSSHNLHKRSPLIFLPPFKLLKKLYLKAKLPFPIG